MEYIIRNMEDLETVPYSVSELHFNNYIGKKTVEKLKLFKNLNLMTYTPNTQISKEARKELASMKIKLKKEVKEAGRRRLEELILPEAALAIVESIRKMEERVLINRPVTTIFYSLFRFQNRLEVITTEERINTLRRVLKARRTNYDRLLTDELEIKIFVVPKYHFKQLFERSNKIKLKLEKNEAEAHILSLQDAVFFSTIQPETYALHDAFIMLFENKRTRVSHYNKFMAFFDDLRKAKRLTRKTFEEKQKFYFETKPPIDYLTIMKGI